MARRPQLHEHDNGEVDRTLCPEPCGTMHTFCTVCGDRQEPCYVDGPTLDRDAAIGHALLQSAVSDLSFLEALEEAGWTIAEHPRFGT